MAYDPRYQDLQNKFLNHFASAKKLNSLRKIHWKKDLILNMKMWLEFCRRIGRIGKLPMWNLEEILDQNQSGLKRNGLFQWNQQSQ